MQESDPACPPKDEDFIGAIANAMRRPKFGSLRRVRIVGWTTELNNMTLRLSSILTSRCRQTALRAAAERQTVLLQGTVPSSSVGVKCCCSYAGWRQGASANKLKERCDPATLCTYSSDNLLLNGLLPKYEALNPKYETSTNCQNANVQNSFEHIQMWFEILVISILNLFRI